MKHSVLLVDDDAHLLDGLRRALHEEPYQVVTAGSGDAALEILAARPVAVVVADEEMPGMRGSQLFARIKATYPDTMRVMLTGQASLEVAMRAINDGHAYRFFTKPCNVRELAIGLRQALVQRTLVVESRRLLQTVRRQSAAMDALEGAAGITAVERDASGAIVLPDAPVDLDRLLVEIETELVRADERLRSRAPEAAGR